MKQDTGEVPWHLTLERVEELEDNYNAIVMYVFT
jgi:hypothetical protein